MAAASKSGDGGNPADGEWTVVSRSGRSPYTAPTPPRGGNEPKPAPTVGDVEEAIVGLDIRDGSRRLEKYDIPVQLSCEGVPAPAEEFEEAEIPMLVQRYSMPIALAKRDLMAYAQTGSEKMASFLLPVLCGLVAAAAGGGGGNEGDHRDSALVLAPTRDLAAQIINAQLGVLIEKEHKMDEVPRFPVDDILQNISQETANKSAMLPQAINELSMQEITCDNFQISINVIGRKVALMVKSTETIESVALRAMETEKVWVTNMYYTSTSQILTDTMTIGQSSLGVNSRLYINARVRGGSGVACSSRSSNSGRVRTKLGNTELVPLLDHIRFEKAGDHLWTKWFRKIHLPPSLREQQPMYGVLLGASARETGRLLAQALERNHSNGKCFNGGFCIQDIFYMPSYNIIEMDAVEVDFTPDGYKNDWLAFEIIIRDHFVFTDVYGNVHYPIYVSYLLSSINALGAYSGYLWRERSILFNHICFKTSLDRKSVISSLLSYQRSLPPSVRSIFDQALGTIPGWIGNARRVPAMYARLYYKRCNPKTKRMEVAKTYIDADATSLLDFCRCLFVHGTTPGLVTEIHVDLAIYAFVWGEFLPYLQKKLMKVQGDIEEELEKLQNPGAGTSAGTAAADLEPIHVMFGLGAVGNDLI